MLYCTCNFTRANIKLKERTRKRVKVDGDSIRWMQWQCRELMLLEVVNNILPPEVVTLLVQGLPPKPSKE